MSKKEHNEHLKKIEEQTQLANERLNQIKYLQADFDNYRKNFEKEKENIIKLANEGLVKELLVILDDFESALKLKSDDDGLKMLYKKIYNILEHKGLKKIITEGKFDPFYHEVILKEKSDKGKGVILEELQAGYTFNSNVIRHSKVKVSQGDVNE